MFFDEYCKLCNSVGKPPTVCAVEMGFHKSEVTRWKKGTVPRRANLLRIADYFGVTPDDLVKEEIKKEPENRLSPNQEELINLVPTLTDEQAATALIMLKLFASQNKSQDDSK